MLRMGGGSMCKTIALSIILLVCFSLPLNSETPDCQQSFEIGERAAREEYRTWGWYFIRVGAGMLGAGVVLTTYYGVPDGVATLGSVLILTAPFIPAVIFPKRDTIYPYFGTVELQCYRDGYKSRARLKNCGALVLGEVTGQVVVFGITWFYFPFMIAVPGL
jgi:hypothetical protein